MRRTARGPEDAPGRRSILFLSGEPSPPVAPRRRAARRGGYRPSCRGKPAEALLNDLIRPLQERFRDGQPERLGRLEVDDQVNLRRLLHGDVGRLGALEDLVHDARRAPVQGDEAALIGHEAPSLRERSVSVYRREVALCRETDEPRRLKHKDPICQHEEPPDAELPHRGECAVELVGAARRDGSKLHSQRPGDARDFLQSRHVRWIGRIPQHGHPGDARHDLLEQRQTLAHYVQAGDDRQAGHVPARSCKAGDQPLRDRVAAAHEDNRDRRACVLGCPCRGWAQGQDDVHSGTDEVGREVREPLALPFCPAVLNGHVPTLHVAEVAQPPTKGSDARVAGFNGRGRVAEDADARGLLRRLRHNGERCGGEHRTPASKECAPVDHWIISSARSSSDGGIVRPILFAAFKLMMSSNTVGSSTGRPAGWAPLAILSMYAAARRTMRHWLGPNSISPPPRTPWPSSKMVGIRCCATNSTMRGRSLPRNGPNSTMSPLGWPRSIPANAWSNSSDPETRTDWTVTPSVGAACSIIWNPSVIDWTLEFQSTATRENFGTASLRSCTRFAAISTALTARPVTFPPGRAKLATRPVSTGSAVPTITIGTVFVTLAASSAATVPGVTSMSTLAATSSAASCGNSFGPPLAALLNSKTTSRPGV